MMEFLIGAMTGSMFTAILALWIERVRTNELNAKQIKEHQERMDAIRRGGIA